MGRLSLWRSTECHGDLLRNAVFFISRALVIKLYFFFISWLTGIEVLADISNGGDAAEQLALCLFSTVARSRHDICV